MERVAISLASLRHTQDEPASLYEDEPLMSINIEHGQLRDSLTRLTPCRNRDHILLALGHRLPASKTHPDFLLAVGKADLAAGGASSGRSPSGPSCQQDRPHDKETCDDR